MTSSPVVTKRLKEFGYFAPTTVSEAVSLLEQYNGEARLLAGGTDILPMMKLRALTPGCIVNLKRIPGLDSISEEGGQLRIGALTTISNIKASDLIREKCPPLFGAAAVFATPQVRNMATIGGNICRSSPCADTVPPLICFCAVLKLAGAKGERTVLLEEFLVGSGKNVLDREVLTEIVIPLRGEKCGAAFTKLTRNSSDLAKVSCAVKITMNGKHCDDVRIVLGAVADRPIRAVSAEEVLKGRETTDEFIEEAARRAVEAVTPITDSRSTVAYRTKVSRVLVRRSIKQAIEKAI